MDQDCVEPICISSEGTGTTGRRKMNLFDMVNEGEDEHKAECPLSKEELGRNTWGLLHTMSMYYPLKPSHKQKGKMRGFIEGFGEFFPCKTCAAHFRTDIQRIKPKLDTREEFAVWVCQIHNETNRVLGKPEFDCDYDNLRRRWYKNDNCHNSLP